MKTKVINKDEAPCKWFALQDRRKRNLANITHFTQQQQTQAIRMQLALQECYNGEVFVNWGKTSFSVKATGLVRDKKSLKVLEASWDQQGITREDSKQGITYRIRK